MGRRAERSQLSSTSSAKQPRRQPGCPRSTDTLPTAEPLQAAASEHPILETQKLEALISKPPKPYSLSLLIIALPHSKQPAAQGEISAKIKLPDSQVDHRVVKGKISKKRSTRLTLQCNASEVLSCLSTGFLPPWGKPQGHWPYPSTVLCLPLELLKR